jgi:hypothetical protein
MRGFGLDGFARRGNFVAGLALFRESPDFSRCILGS